MSAAPRSSTRERLLDVAEKEFARYGYAGAHLQSIAEQVGFQKTALYHYFDSKSALYTSVIESMLEDFEKAVTTAVQSAGSYTERLDRLLAAFNDLLAARPNYARILIRIFIDGAGVEFETVGPVIQRVIGGLLSFYREGADAGAFRPLSSRQVFLSLFGSVLFHYAAPGFSENVLGVDDIYAGDVVAWRRAAVRELLLRGVLPEGS